MNTFDWHSPEAQDLLARMLLAEVRSQELADRVQALDARLQDLERGLRIAGQALREAML